MERRGFGRVVLAVGVVGLLGSAAWGKYGGGSGTAAAPYLIYTAEHLREVGLSPGDWGEMVYYKLMADIDLADLNQPMDPIGTELQSFEGNFDGNGKTISNLKIDCSSGNNIGLFGYVGADIHDLGLVNVKIDAPQSTCVGALAGWVFGQVDRCYVRGGSVCGADEVGGLVGGSYCSASQCHTTCTVKGVNQVGGLFGSHIAFHTIDQCYSKGSVSGTQYVGGLVGYNCGLLKDCYVIADVRGDWAVGGLMGFGDWHGVLWNCYAVGKFSGTTSVGGVFGHAAKCYGCFWDVQVGGPMSTVSGVGKTTSQMQTAVTFRGWGRSGAWTIQEGGDYPKLAWENRPGSPLTTPAFPDTEGQGTAQYPYLIGTPAQLDAIGDCPGEWNQYYRLVADIDLAGLNGPFHMIGCQYIPFTGTFDGDNFSVSNFVCPDSIYGVGLLGWIQGATVKRIRLLNPRVDPGWSISVGALVGQQVEGTVEACGSEGGLVAGEFYVGGLIGRCTSGTVTRCYSTCTVRGLAKETREDTGGLLGKGEWCNVNNAYAAGPVTGQANVGGLIGNMEGGTVSHCYSTGAVAGVTNVGGLVGLAQETLAAGCFWDAQTSGWAASAVGTGLTTAELQKAATFIPIGWDFVGENTNGRADIWAIDEGKDYPCFYEKPDVPSEQIWADDFADGEPSPLWQVYEPQPARLSIREINGRLEVHVPEATEDAVSAAYLSSGWALDGSQDFSLSVDFHFARLFAGEGSVSITLAPSIGTPVSQRMELTAGCLDGESVHSCTRADGVGFAASWTARGSDNGTLYVSYDAAVDNLYLSYTGYGPANAWRTITGLLKGRWAGDPVYVLLGGAADGVEIEDGDAWLDNFAVQAGTILE